MQGRRRRTARDPRSRSPKPRASSAPKSETSSRRRRMRAARRPPRRWSGTSSTPSSGPRLRPRARAPAHARAAPDTSCRPWRNACQRARGVRMCLSRGVVSHLSAPPRLVGVRDRVRRRAGVDRQHGHAAANVRDSSGILVSSSASAQSRIASCARPTSAWILPRNTRASTRASLLAVSSRSASTLAVARFASPASYSAPAAASTRRARSWASVCGREACCSLVQLGGDDPVPAGVRAARGGLESRGDRGRHARRRRERGGELAPRRRGESAARRRWTSRRRSGEARSSDARRQQRVREQDIVSPNLDHTRRDRRNEAPEPDLRLERRAEERDARARQDGQVRRGHRGFRPAEPRIGRGRARAGSWERRGARPEPARLGVCSRARASSSAKNGLPPETSCRRASIGLG